MIDRVTSQFPVSLRYRPWLHRFAVLVVVVTFVVIVSGGNVTSRDAGLAVPDGYTVYGYFLWAFPFEKWVGNVWHEHVHRLNGSVIGVLSIVLAGWLFAVNRDRRWVRLAGLLMLAMVLIQGVLGAMRVDEISTFYAVVHGIHAQMILCVAVLIAAATSRLWVTAQANQWMHPDNNGGRLSARIQVLSIVVLAVMLVQLILGATMRHTGAGLAIPDFPSAYGGFVPPMTEQGIHNAIDQLPYEQVTHYYSPAQVGVHFAHRVWALIVLGAVAWLLSSISIEAPGESALNGPMTALAGLLVSQVALGAVVIWSGRHNEAATAHQAIGAASLATAALLALRVYVLRRYFGPISHAVISQQQPVLPLENPAA